MHQQQHAAQYRQDQHISLTHRQRQLPPLRDTIKPELGDIVSTAIAQQEKYEGDYDIPFSDCKSSESTPLAVSPTQSLGRSMPSLSQSFEDLQFRGYNDDMLSGSSNWGSGSQYSNSTGSYASSTSSTQSYYNRPSLSSTRTNQNLPSLNEMNLGNPTMYSSRPSQLSNLPTRSSNRYATPSYTSSPTDPLEISFSRNGQGTCTYSTAFPAVTSSRIGYGTSQYYDSPFPDAGYYTNGTSYPPTMYSTGSNYIGSDTASIGSSRRRRGNLPKHVTDILRAWFHEHLDHPYPTDEDKQMLIQRTNLSIQQISNWFINARRRHWPALKAQRQVHNGQTRHSNSNNSSL